MNIYKEDDSHHVPNLFPFHSPLLSSPGKGEEEMIDGERSGGEGVNKHEEGLTNFYANLFIPNK